MHSLQGSTDVVVVVVDDTLQGVRERLERRVVADLADSLARRDRRDCADWSDRRAEKDKSESRVTRARTAGLDSLAPRDRPDNQGPLDRPDLSVTPGRPALKAPLEMPGALDHRAAPVRVFTYLFYLEHSEQTTL